MARLFSARTLILGGIALGAAYAAKNKRAVSGLLTDTPRATEPAPSPAAAPVGTAATTPGPAPAPAVANVDVDGPPENTATHVPAPDPAVHEPEGGIDEEAEEAAAAAEAANIGGVPEDYPDPEDPSLEADEAMRPLEEAGEGYNEGQELAESDLIENTESSGGDPIEAERQIDEIIEAQDDPFSGESGEALEQLDLSDEAETEVVAGDLGEPAPTEVMDVPPPPTGAPIADVPPPETETAAGEKGSAVWRTDEPGPAKTEDGA